MPPSSEPRVADAPAVRLLLRFTRGERWVHRGTGAVMGVGVVTAAILYLGPLSVLVGRRALVEQIHVIAGIALPVPILAGWMSAAFRTDVRRLNRFTASDWAWLRSRDRRSGRLRVGKFNAGQKLNASFVTGAILALLGTGLIMRFANHWPLFLRTGATFVHDWLSYAVAGVLLGHIMFALRDRAARTGMRSGLVPVDWAYAEHRAWADDLDGPGLTGREVNPQLP